MKLVYGISRWTNAIRASARHIDNGNGEPLCGNKRKVFSWEKEEGMPTCEKCLSIRMGEIVDKELQTETR